MNWWIKWLRMQNPHANLCSLQWNRCCMAHWSRLSQGIIFHCKIIIYTTSFLGGATRHPLGLWYHTWYFLHIYFCRWQALPTAHISTGWISKSGINSWKWLAYMCYVVEFETYVPYVSTFSPHWHWVLSEGDKRQKASGKARVTPKPKSKGKKHLKGKFQKKKQLKIWDGCGVKLVLKLKTKHLIFIGDT
jgi:hypothetical protein